MELLYKGERYKSNRKYAYRLDDAEVTLYERRLRKGHVTIARLIGVKTMATGRCEQIFKSNHLYELLITAINSGNARPIDNKPMTEGPVLVGEWSLRAGNAQYVEQHERLMARA